MSRYDYSGSSQFRPLSPWGYVGYSILFVIPVIGWICLIVFTFSQGNINRRSFARSYWCWMLMSLITAVVVFAVGFAGRRMNMDGLTENGLLNVPRTFITRLFKLDDAGTGETPGSVTSDTAKETKAPASGIANTANFVSAQTVKDTTVKDTDTKKTAQVSSSARGVTPEFKAAMDSYETFFNEYVAFIKKFENDSSNLAMLGDYAAFMTRYADMIQKVDAIEETKLSAADDAYYLEATVRIYKKLAEISM